MSKYSKMSKVAKSGSVDSKYFNNTEQFEKDVQSKIDASNKFKEDIKELILSDPNKLTQRYHEVIEVMLKIKEEYEI